jgi:Bacterial extracellular solute-binding protein/von Willebrand factor type A domain
LGRHSSPRRSPTSLPATGVPPSRHRSRRYLVGGRVLIVVLATVAATTVAAVATRDRGEDGASPPAGMDGCDAALRVVTASSFAPVLAELERSLAGDDCLRLEVTQADGRAAAGRVARLDADVWIPDDAAWATTAPGGLLAEDGAGGTGSTVAISPVYMVTDRGTAQRIERAGRSWSGLAELLTNGSGVRLAVRDPAGSGDGLVAVGGLAEAVWLERGMDSSALMLATALRVTRTVSGAKPALPARAGEVGLVPEYALLSRPEPPARDLTVFAARDHTSLLRYTWLPTAEAVRSPVRSAALSRLLAALGGPDAADVLGTAGLRRTDGAAPPDATNDRLQDLGGQFPDLTATPFDVLGTHHVDHVFATWYVTDRRTNLLIVIDVSGSMAEPAPGSDTPLIDLVGRGCLDIATLLPADSRLGLWEFGAGLDPPADHRSLLPSAPLTSAHRAALAAAVAGLAARRTGTGLYDTILAAYAAAVRGYRPGVPNQVLVFTDGRNEDDPNSITAAELSARLAAAADPDRPVQLAVVGFGARPEIELLRDTLEPVEGYVKPVGSAADVPAVLIHVAAGGLHL